MSLPRGLVSWERNQAEPPCPGWLLGLDGVGFSLSDSELVAFPELEWGPDTLSAPALQPPGPRPQRRSGQPAAHSLESRELVDQSGFSRETEPVREGYSGVVSYGRGIYIHS